MSEQSAGRFRGRAEPPSSTAATGPRLGEWVHDGDVVDVSEKLGLELLAITGADFSHVADEPTADPAPAPAKAPQAPASASPAAKPAAQPTATAPAAQAPSLAVV